MKQVEFAIVIHNHQPVGNFDHVIEDAYAKAYLPFLELLERRSEVRIGLHNSGCLWEWLEAKHPEYGRRIDSLVKSGQIELLGGGFYEPILPLLPERDRRGQVKRMTRFLNERFGVTPRGIWLAERVWEPHLAHDLAEEGIRFVALDDSQFHAVGLKDDQLKGYYLTEDSGKSLALYPISMRLRYEIPFASPEAVLQTLMESADERDGTMRLFADDGEKFGIWPGTHDLCYEERWLDRFFDSLSEAKETVCLVLPSEHREKHRPLGRIYLPDGSYREMTEWALPVDAALLLSETERFLREQEKEEAVTLLLRGGFFRNFLVHYPESNQMHKRVLLAHESLDAAGSIDPAAVSEIRDHLWRAQCNCSYWHGVFGGIYLPHLRDAIYREVLRGERLLDRELRGEQAWVDARTIDYNGDGDEEVILTSDSLGLFISPMRGGGLLELDDRACARNLVNSLTRRREECHSRLRPDKPSDDDVHTIHDGAAPKEENLESRIAYDISERVGLNDRFFDRPPTPEEMNRDPGIERGDFIGSPYELVKVDTGNPVRAVLKRLGRLRHDSASGLELTKTITLEAGKTEFSVELLLRSMAEQRMSFCFGIDNLFNLLAGNAPDRYLLVDGERIASGTLDSLGSHQGAHRISLVDDWEKLRIDVEAEGAQAWVHAPIETVSLSESGAERIFQGTVVMPLWKIDLEPGSSVELAVRIAISHGTATDGGE